RLRPACRPCRFAESTMAGNEIDLWTLYPSRRLLSARVSAFLDFLKQDFPNGTADELAAYIGR
ncbi:hypothetical protein ACC724_40135, partial [Rhizobium ruizarguesonis]